MNAYNYNPYYMNMNPIIIMNSYSYDYAYYRIPIIMHMIVPIIGFLLVSLLLCVL